MNRRISANAGTFTLNKVEPIHRWYSYVEGYSSCLVISELEKVLEVFPTAKNIYDPFNGTGTTCLVAAMKGMNSYYSESNPFMQFVAETKINGAVGENIEALVNKIQRYKDMIQSIQKSQRTTWDGFEKYYGLEQMQYVLAIKELFSSEHDTRVKNYLFLALSSVIVKVSKMTRRGDLRYATENEYHPENVVAVLTAKLDEIMQDLLCQGHPILNGTIKVSDDARENKYQDLFDCVITSPPYLNGTNYIRNTKLELKLNDYIETEKDLPAFHSKGIIAGINNVSKRNGIKAILPEVEPFMDEVVRVAYDERIPKMIAGYFYDMNDVILALAHSMRVGGYFIMDIGDSQFGGVHIPTHDILSNLCTNHGFVKLGEEIIRERSSKNGMRLSQRILRFRLEK